MKLSSDAAVTCLTYEGITNFLSLMDFDTKSIEQLPATCKETIVAVVADVDAGIAEEPEVASSNISSISIRCIIIAMYASNYYEAIGRTMTVQNMHCANVLLTFKLEWETYQELRKQDEPGIPVINDKDRDRKVIKWVPIFLDCLTHTYGLCGPLIYVLCD